MTRYKQQDSPLQEQGEGIFPLEADRDEVSPVVPSELGGASATNGYTRSLGGMKAPGPLVVARIPSVNVPVCVLTSVAKCVLQRVHSVSERPCVTETTCVRERYEREMTVGMREHATACPSVME